LGARPAVQLPAGSLLPLSTTAAGILLGSPPIGMASSGATAATRTPKPWFSSTGLGQVSKRLRLGSRRVAGLIGAPRFTPRRRQRLMGTSRPTGWPVLAERSTRAGRAGRPCGCAGGRETTRVMTMGWPLIISLFRPRLPHLSRTTARPSCCWAFPCSALPLGGACVPVPENACYQPWDAAPERRDSSGCRDDAPFGPVGHGLGGFEVPAGRVRSPQGLAGWRGTSTPSGQMIPLAAWRVSLRAPPRAERFELVPSRAEAAGFLSPRWWSEVL